MLILDYRNILAERILVFDGAMGTNLQRFNPSIDDYQGKEGCTEILNITHPEWIRAVHASFLQAGCDVIETNSFGANRIVLGEYGLADRVLEFNRLAAKMAKEVAYQFSSKKVKKFVAGSMGPGTKLPSLGHIDFDTLRAAYAEQARGLLEGGADLFLIETCQDLLQIKAAINGALDAQKKVGVQIPMNVQVTIESTGAMLVGTDMATAINVIECFPVDTIGINCATGPMEMSEHIRTLSQLTTRFISCLPNAGLPENVDGKAVYKLTPQDLAGHLSEFVKTWGVNVVGGCCGTTEAHMKAVADAVKYLRPVRRNVKKPAALSSLYMTVPIRQSPAPLIVGERTNTNGSKKFRDLLTANDYDALVGVAKDQEDEGAHVLDVCTAFVGRDEVYDMTEVINNFSLQVRIPLMIDSTETSVMEAALKKLGGKPIVNSINLEDGKEKLARVCGLLKTYGAAVVALTIDESGMAKTVETKLAVAKRIYELAVRKYDVPPENLVFDPLTFTLGSGDEDTRRAGIETLEAINRIKFELPKVSTILGVSNISFGLNPAARVVLNSVFLHYAVAAGLDAAIVNAKKILPLHKIDPRAQELARQLIFDERKKDASGHVIYDPLKEFLSFFSENKSQSGPETAVIYESVEKELQARIIDGNKRDIDKLLEEALKSHPALEIINSILLEGMKTVGELFGKGELQLPFVLQSAETMKAAVKFLEPHIPKSESNTQKGTMVLATVRGDVHDIGKNLVDIILTNNGYRVVNLGIKQPLEAILKAAEDEKADVIGLSGLLVKSTAVMKENLEEMNRRKSIWKVILGGAALTRRYVEHDLRSIYQGQVYYARDAFEGLHLMDELLGITSEKNLTDSYEVKDVLANPAVGGDQTPVSSGSAPLTVVKISPPNIPKPPFWGSRVIKGIDLKEIFKFINETALLKVRWGFKRLPNMTKEEYEALLKDTVEPLYLKWKKYVMRENIFHPMVTYGYFPCQSEGNDLIVYDDKTDREVTRFNFPRQKKEPFLCIADFFRAKNGERDVLPLMIVTIGRDATPRIQELYKSQIYTDYLYLHGLSVEFAEALAEYWHKRIREELSIAGDDSPQVKDLFQQSYRGSRYSFGYPACPNLEDQEKICRLLDPSRIGVELSETYQLHPEQSVSALVVHHPQAKYFSVG